MEEASLQDPSVEMEIYRQGTGFPCDTETTLARFCHPQVPFVGSRDSESELAALSYLAHKRIDVRNRMEGIV